MEEDGLQDDEDYDSQEEMDNMMDDIDIVAKREDTAEGEGDGEAEIEDIQSTSPELMSEHNPFKSDASLTSETTAVEPNNIPELPKKIEQSLEIENQFQDRARLEEIQWEEIQRLCRDRAAKNLALLPVRLLEGLI